MGYNYSSDLTSNGGLVEPPLKSEHEWIITFHRMWLFMHVPKTIKSCEHRETQGGCLNINMLSYIGKGIPIIKVRRSHDRLTFIMEIHIHGKAVFIPRRGPDRHCWSYGIVNTMRPRQSGRHFADDTFNYTEICSVGSSWRYGSIGSDNGLAPKMWQYEYVSR